MSIPESMVTRIDLLKNPDNVVVMKWLDGWKAGDKPDTVYQTTEYFDEMLDWLRARGWDVVEWGIGARAWKGGRKPVRPGWAIKKKRAEVNQNREWYAEQGLDNLSSLNLAFYL
jgi:hypothetical protein